MKPLVSICIPCHNAAPYVGAALDSVLAQTWPNLEIIVVNDGSTDDSLGVLQKYRDRGVKVIDEKCGSASKARNRAYMEATGEYIKYFDADDLMSENMISLQMERLNGRRDAVASSEWGRFYGDDLETFKLNPQSVWRDMDAKEWLVESWRDARPMMQPGLFLIPREIIDKAGCWNENLSLIDDFEYFARVLCYTEEVLFASGTTLYYRSGMSRSLSQQASNKAIKSAYDSSILATSHLLSRRNDSTARLSCANIFQALCFMCYPADRNLSERAAKKVRELGGSDLKFASSRPVSMVESILGWKVAWRIQSIIRRVKSS